MLKKVLALLLAGAMVIGSVMPAMASSVEAVPTAPTSGSITINSPIIGAQYFAYKIFTETTNADVDAFSYTISDTDPFYDAVVAYAAMPASGTDANADGLTLTATNSDPHTFNIETTSAFNARTFGEYIRDYITTNDAKDASDTTKKTLTPINPNYATGTAVSVDDGKALKFNDLALGYYLITNKYPTYNKEYKLTVPAYTDNDGTEHAAEEITLTNKSTDAEVAAAIAKYVDAMTTDAKVDQYITDQGLKTEKYGAGNESKWTDKDTLDVKNQLVNTYSASVEAQMNQIRGDDSDFNVKEPVLIFVDSSQPNAVINEKNEIPKWDEPINPTGYAKVEGEPEHGEPEGGKNIIVREQEGTNPAIYADWTEANVGDHIHYQLSINATNYDRLKDSTQSDAAESVKQIKEYVIADFQNKNMTFYDEDPAGEALVVRIVTKDAAGNIVSTLATLDYTPWADKFFMNDSNADTAPANLWATDDTKGGIAIPWVEEVIPGTTINPNSTSEPKAAYTKAEVEALPNVTKNSFDTTTPVYKAASDADVEAGNIWTDADGFIYYSSDKTANGRVQATDASGNPVWETEDHYFVSKYPNDVTIIVDYYMTLTENATVDGTGNKNVAQFGVDYIDGTEKTYTQPQPSIPEDKNPSEKKEQDDATVYTYALALHKVDNAGNNLAGAKFKIMGLTLTEKAAGYYKVATYDPESTTYGTEMSTDSEGLLVIEGLQTSATLTIQETEAPEGFNKLEGTITGNATKLSETVTTSYTETYFDADGNQVDQKSGSASTTTIVTTIDNLKKLAIEIVNNKGTELPSTGGIGTTLFYAGGAILVLLAGILLVSKRRMA